MQKTRKAYILSVLEILFEKYLQVKNTAKFHPDGTYISAKLSAADSKKLFKFASDLKIPELVDKTDYHATIIYSRKGIPEVKDYKITVPITAKIVGWNIFKTQTGARCLVAILESKALTNTHEYIMSKYGATYDFKEYLPHITVSYDYGSDVAPKESPDMTVTFDVVSTEGLDPVYIPKKAKT